MFAELWLLVDFNSRFHAKDNAFGGLQLDIVGPWSLKNDKEPNDNCSAILKIACANNLRHVATHFNICDSKNAGPDFTHVIELERC